MLQQTHHTLDNGIGSFQDASPDYELAPVGLGSFQGQAQKLADFGRNGDIYVVHAAEGETVVPMEVFDANPKVKELLFGQMREMGLDPQEFIVGNELNSINPVTGMPEFFFKSVFRSVKKAVKKIVKVVKKAAPIVLPIAASMFGVPFLGIPAGSFAASFLGSGIGTLVGGGSIKDAFKSAIIGGGMASLGAGLRGALSSTGTFMGGLEGSFTGLTPVYNPGDFTSPIGYQVGAIPTWGTDSSILPGIDATALGKGQAVSSAQWDKILGGDVVGGVTGEGSLFGPEPTKDSLGFVPIKPTGSVTPNLSPNAAAIQRAAQGVGAGTAVQYPPAAFSGADLSPGDLSSRITNAVDIQKAFVPGARELTALETGLQYSPFAKSIHEVPGQAGQYLVGEPAQRAASRVASLAKAQDILGPNATVVDALKAGDVVAKEVISAGKRAAAATMPGVAQKYGPTLALGAGAAYLGGAFDPPEEVPQPTQKDLNLVADLGPTGPDLYKKNREKYDVAQLSPTRFVPSGTPLIPTTFPALQGSEGGMAEFPRRQMLVEGPGTETSDDIPAMLSDGEFVMNARSVRGADPSGNGDRYAGAKNLYDMMRNFEMRA